MFKFGAGRDNNGPTVIGPAAKNLHSTGWDLMGDLSITAAFTAETLVPSSTVFTTVQSSATTVSVPCFRFGITNSPARWFYQHATTNSASSLFTAASDATANPATFGTKSITIQRDDLGANGGTVIVKVNKKPVISATYTQAQKPNCSNANELRVLTNAWDGKIFELRIWDEAVPQAKLDVVADWLNPLYTQTAAGGEYGLYWFGAKDDNLHGTTVADILDLQNAGGGNIHVYNWGTGDGPQRAAYEHIYTAHAPEMHVISTSISQKAYSGDICLKEFDDVLLNLVNDQIYIASAHPNPGTGFGQVYPGNTPFAISVGGVLDGSPWSLPPGSLYGRIFLDQINCPDQYAFNNALTGSNPQTQIFKPDVYGSFEVYVDRKGGGANAPGTTGGNSYAQPQIASGLGTIVSRVLLQKNTWIPFKTWNGSCFEGAVRLVWESGAPDNRAINVAAAYNLGGSELSPAHYEVGRMADHNHWYMGNAYTCG